jgi:hypothetical protein
MEGSYRYLLVLEDGRPADPAAHVSPRADWRDGDVFKTKLGRTYEIVSQADPEGRADVVGHLFDRIWVVRPTA